MIGIKGFMYYEHEETLILIVNGGLNDIIVKYNPVSKSLVSENGKEFKKCECEDCSKYYFYAETVWNMLQKNSNRVAFLN